MENQGFAQFNEIQGLWSFLVALGVQEVARTGGQEQSKSNPAGDVLLSGALSTVLCRCCGDGDLSPWVTMHPLAGL